MRERKRGLAFFGKMEEEEEEDVSSHQKGDGEKRSFFTDPKRRERSLFFGLSLHSRGSLSLSSLSFF